MSTITLTGPDVSNLQGDVDWNAVKHAGHDFAIVKTTEGLTFDDSFFGPGRWNAMKQAGLVRGVYHYAIPQPGRDPRDEVVHFHRAVQAAGGLQRGDLRPALDIETAKNLPAKEIVTWVRGFLHHAHEIFGVMPIVYTGNFWRDDMGNPARSVGAPLWLAAYVKDPNPYIPHSWSKRGISIWQHTSSATVPGIKKACDLNRFQGTQAEFNALLVK